MTFPILIDVEDSALGGVLKLLHGYPGIAKIHLDLDAAGGPKGTRKGVPIGPRKQREENAPSSTAIITAFIMTGPKRNSQVAEELERHGFSRTSSASTLTALKEKGVVYQIGNALWDLTDEAKARLKPTAALPAPADEITASDLVLQKMKSQGGTARRLELAQHLSSNNLSAASISRVMSDLKKRGKITNDAEPGVYHLAPTNGAAPAEKTEKAAKNNIKAKPEAKTPERSEKRTAIIKLLKRRKRPMTVPEIAAALDVKRGMIDGAMWRLQQLGEVEKVSPGVFQISTKNAAEEPSTAQE